MHGNFDWPMNAPEPLVIAILGAESTGKTQLAQGLSARLVRETGLRCTWVPEHLRAWCNTKQRTPLEHEQADIARAQQQEIEAAAATHDVVICDTTPLSTAVYSQWVFGDDSLTAQAALWQRRCAITLLTALDLPWQADGLRDGPHARGPVDDLFRRALLAHQLPWAGVYGRGTQREESALDAIAPLLRRRAMPRDGLFTRLAERGEESSRWTWRCDTCDVPDCEHLALQLRRAAADPR